MANPFRRLLAKYRLWKKGYCTRHLIEKLPASARYRRDASPHFPGELVDVTCHTLDVLYPDPFCELCREEKQKREKSKLDRSLQELGGRLG